MGAHRLRVPGWTLVELAAVLALVAILAALALPSFSSMLMRRHLEGIAAQVSADLQYLRSEAVARNATVHMAFQATAAGSCYVIHTGASGDCRCTGTQPPQCAASTAAAATAIRHAGFGADSPVQVQANVAALRIDPRLGTVSPTGTVRVVAADGGAVHHIVSILGRVRTCSPGGLTGFPEC
jgi:type IV fimbrial biogenesis protein FimT